MQPLYQYVLTCSGTVLFKNILKACLAYLIRWQTHGSFFNQNLTSSFIRRDFSTPIIGICILVYAVQKMFSCHLRYLMQTLPKPPFFSLSAQLPNFFSHVDITFPCFANDLLLPPPISLIWFPRESDTHTHPPLSFSLSLTKIYIREGASFISYCRIGNQ